MTEPCATTNRNNGTNGADLQAQARDYYRSKLADGETLSGTELGSRFHRSPQWGRMVAAQARAEVNGDGLPDRGGANRPHGDRDGDATAHGDELSRGANGRRSAGSDRSGGANGRAGGANGLRADRVGDANKRGGADGDCCGGANSPGPRCHAGESVGASALSGNAGGGAATHVAVTPGVRRVTTLAVLSVALVAAVVSFEHQRELALVAVRGGVRRCCRSALMGWWSRPA